MHQETTHTLTHEEKADQTALSSIRGSDGLDNTQSMFVDETDSGKLSNISNEDVLFASIVLDIPTRALDKPYDYLLPQELQERAHVGCSVVVDFAHRPALGYIVGISKERPSNLDASRIKPVREILSTPLFDEAAVDLAFWIAREYLAPLSDCMHLLTPPGGTAKIKKDTSGSWTLIHPQAGPVDDRWVQLSATGEDYEPPANATKQRAVIETLRFGEMRMQDLALSVENPASAVQALERRGFVIVEHRRRVRGSKATDSLSTALTDLTAGQRAALKTVYDAVDTSKRHQTVILLDGITGSGKTEVYLQAISKVLEGGGSACVLVPEISLTPQTVSRFRGRFGDEVAVLHSRLSAGERFDQWELVRSGAARVVVGARSALFAPLKDLRLIVIDEEHESSYKQGSSPRYVSRAVAIKRAELCGAVVVLGSATPSLESLYAAGLCSDEKEDNESASPLKENNKSPRLPLQQEGVKPDSLVAVASYKTAPYVHVELSERVSGRPLPSVEVVDLAAEFHTGNKTMYSFKLKEALRQTIERGEKAVLLLNKRGFASVLLCRDCGYVPTCADCDTSLTFHQRPAHLKCHYCDAQHAVPAVCPECGSPYLKQLGPGTQFAADQLAQILPPYTTIVRMDADTTRLKDGHEKRLEEFAAAESGVLLGTQMIAKGLDFADVTLVGVLIADVALKFPDFRAAERTWQLLEQVAGRAGRAEKDGKVIVQTYWPEHVAIRAAAGHNRAVLVESECEERRELAYPPFGRLANILVWGKDEDAVKEQVVLLAQVLRPQMPQQWQLLGPSPCIISKRQGSHRWHILIKAPGGADIPGWLAPLLKAIKTHPTVNRAVDIDPQDMM